MAQDNDELARLLSGMADGQYSDDPAQPRRETPDSAPHAPPPAQPATPQPKPMARPKPATLTPQVKPRIVTPRPAPAPAPARPAPRPEGHFDAAPPEDDDAVIVPAPPASALGQSRARPAPPRQQHFVQSLTFQQAIIPVSLSLAGVCILFLIVGYSSADGAPFAAFRRSFVPFVLAAVAVLMLAVGTVTMLMVRHQLQRHARQQPAGS